MPRVTPLEYYKRINQLMNVYSVLMTEVRTRNEAINALIDQPGDLPPHLVREFCFLQLRMMAELVAQGCVVLHDRLPPTEVKKLRREYHPDKILAIIETYEPRFFPQAVAKIELVEEGHKMITPHDPPIMDAKGLRRLWGRTGAVLHWGTVDKMRERTAIDPNHKEIRLLQQRFIDLLSVHIILTDGETQPFICEMWNKTTGAVNIAYAQRLDPE